MSNGQTGFYGTKPLCSCLVGESQSVGVTQDRQRERENCDAQCPGNPACLEGRGWSASRSRSDGMSLWDSLARASSARQRAAPGAVPGPSLYEIRSGAQKSEQWRHRRPAATEILSLRPRTAVATAGTTWCQTIAPSIGGWPRSSSQCSRFNMAASGCSRWTDLAAARFVEAVPFRSGG